LVTCPGVGLLDIGPLADNGDGTYAFDATDVAGTPMTADIRCSWDSPPAGREVAATETVTFTSVALVNLLLGSNGGVLDSWSSEYCDPGNLPGNCLDTGDPGTEYWNHTNIHDGEHAHGYNPTAFLASWASGNKQGAGDPEVFTFSFDAGRTAWIKELVVQNYGEEPGAGPYYATHVTVYVEFASIVTQILDEDLELTGTQADREAPVVFDLEALNGEWAHARRLILEVTGSVHPDYWELGEFEAWGILE
jgi:hypothetical protein